MNLVINKVLDCKGLACPMPIVRTKKMIGELNPGEVLEIQATDKGSTADIQAWAKNTGHEYLGTEAEGDLLKHYLRKGGELKETIAQKIEEISIEDFQRKVESGEPINILDVREYDEFNERHIPGVIHIPLGEIENRYNELDKNMQLHVICHSGKRSEMAVQLLDKNGFKNLINVVPGMGFWTGKTE